MKQVPRALWEEWSDLFCNRNRGRAIIREMDDEAGNEFLVEGAQLVAFDYDPPDKGYAFIISYGPESAPTRHVVDNPITPRQGQDAIGLVIFVSIEDEPGNVTMCRLE